MGNIFVQLFRTTNYVAYEVEIVCCLHITTLCNKFCVTKSRHHFYFLQHENLLHTEVNNTTHNKQTQPATQHCYYWALKVLFYPTCTEIVL